MITKPHNSPQEKQKYSRPHLQKEVKGTLEISNEIFNVLNTNRSTDHVLGDASMLLLLRRHIGVSHGRRVLDERFNTTKRHSKLEVVEIVEDCEGLLLATLDEEGNIGTRTTVLFLEDADLFLTHGLAAGVVNSLNSRVLKEEFHNLLCVLCLGTHTELEGRKRTCEQPSRIGVSDRTKDSAHHLDLTNELFASSSDTSNDIGVATDELGSRVHNDVSTPLVRLAEDRATECVIDDKEAVVLLCNARSSLEVSHSDCRVGRGLHIDDLALALGGIDSSLDISLRAAGLEGVRGDLEGREDGAHEELGATVDGIREGDVVTRAKEGKACGGDCTHTTAHDSSSLGQGVPDGDLALEDLRVGVCNTTVNKSGNLAFVGLPQSISDFKSSFSLFCILEHEGRSAEDGRNDSTFRPLGDVATVENLSLGMNRAHFTSVDNTLKSKANVTIRYQKNTSHHTREKKKLRKKGTEISSEKK